MLMVGPARSKDIRRSDVHAIPGSHEGCVGIYPETSRHASIERGRIQSSTLIPPLPSRGGEGPHSADFLSPDVSTLSYYCCLPTPTLNIHWLLPPLDHIMHLLSHIFLKNSITDEVCTGTPGTVHMERTFKLMKLPVTPLLRMKVTLQ